MAARENQPQPVILQRLPFFRRIDRLIFEPV